MLRLGTEPADNQKAGNQYLQRVMHTAVGHSRRGRFLRTDGRDGGIVLAASVVHPYVHGRRA